ncbi:MAG: sulfite exporter TauE/SafE family protein [Burkholderiales bacterium]|nr:sulfite exporter TauE/SafE family protein [Burkholderiales bacterium]
MIELSLTSVFLVGLLGGIHCAGMCGGVIALTGSRGRVIPIRSVSGDGTALLSTAPNEALAAWASRVAMNAGRISSYTAAGALAGGVGSTAWLAQHLLPVQQIGFALASVVMIALGLYLLGWNRLLRVLEPLGTGVWRRVQPLAIRATRRGGLSGSFLAGALWGWLPCGMVYGVLVAALVSGSAQHGAALALAFGLGTLPNLLLLGWLAQRAAGLLDRPWLRRAGGLLVIAFGVAGLARLDPTQHLHPLIDACISWLR